MKYALIEKYNPTIHGNRKEMVQLLKDKYICLDTKESGTNIFDYHTMFEDYTQECKERNNEITNEIPVFALITQKVIKGTYTIAIPRDDIIIKIQRLWRNYKKKFTVDYLNRRQMGL